MFRRPTDESSSSLESSSGEDIIEIAQAESHSEDPFLLPLSVTESLSSNTDQFGPDPRQNEEAPGTSSHSNLIIASLLDFHSQVRAAELLNTKAPGAPYTRHSPEAQLLAKRLFLGSSRQLASYEILPRGLEKDEMQNLRRQYLAAIDNLGLQSLKESDLIPTNSTGAIVQHNANMTVTSSSPFKDNNFEYLLAQLFKDLGIESSSMQLPRPYNDMQLSIRSSPTLSRYRREFNELRVLGRGGFGTVFHAFNVVDSQHYAIKKIPVSLRQLKKWQEGDTDVAKEIRNFARFEHCNIVRYYSAWFEGEMNQVVTSGIPETYTEIRRSSLPRRKLLKGQPLPVGADKNGQHARIHTISSESSDGIVFGDDSFSQQPKVVERSVSPSRSVSQVTSTMSLDGSEIFTDGNSDVRQAPNTTKSPFALHIQMSLHPMTLTSFLRPASSNEKHGTTKPLIQHCFHLLPSLRLLLGILCGLQYLHAMGVIHRDIKPGNIFLSESIQSATPGPGYIDIASCPNCAPRSTPYFINPRIGDFGLVAEIMHSSSSPSTAPSSSSRPASSPKAVGTQFYRPPPSTSTDRAMLDMIDEKLDVFALGMVLFELLWPFDTRMERHLLLGELSRNARLPDQFASRIAAAGDNDDDAAAAAAQADSVADCIKAMVNPDAAARWGCDRVKRHLELIETACLDRTSGKPRR